MKKVISSLIIALSIANLLVSCSRNDGDNKEVNNQSQSQSSINTNENLENKESIDDKNTENIANIGATEATGATGEVNEQSASTTDGKWHWDAELCWETEDSFAYQVSFYPTDITSMDSEAPIVDVSSTKIPGIIEGVTTYTSFTCFSNGLGGKVDLVVVPKEKGMTKDDYELTITDDTDTYTLSETGSKEYLIQNIDNMRSQLLNIDGAWYHIDLEDSKEYKDIATGFIMVVKCKKLNNIDKWPGINMDRFSFLSLDRPWNRESLPEYAKITKLDVMPGSSENSTTYFEFYIDVSQEMRQDLEEWLSTHGIWYK